MMINIRRVSMGMNGNGKKLLNFGKIICISVCLLSNRNNLELALSRPVTVLDNERFTVQSVITKLVCPVVLVSSWCVLPNVFCIVFEHEHVNMCSLMCVLLPSSRWHSCLLTLFAFFLLPPASLLDATILFSFR